MQTPTPHVSPHTLATPVIPTADPTTLPLLTSTRFPCPLLVSCTQQKNVSSDNLDGKVGRIYMPKQNMDTLGLSKYKGTKRERRESAREASEAKKRPKTATAPTTAGGDDE